MLQRYELEKAKGIKMYGSIIVFFNFCLRILK